jgi:hypothetical protein
LKPGRRELSLCPGCLRELDHPFMTEVDSLRQRAEDAQHKLGGSTRHHGSPIKRSGSQSWRSLTAPAKPAIRHDG